MCQNAQKNNVHLYFSQKKVSLTQLYQFEAGDSQTLLHLGYPPTIQIIQVSSIDQLEGAMDEAFKSKGIFMLHARETQKKTPPTDGMDGKRHETNGGYSIF